MSEYIINRIVLLEKELEHLKQMYLAEQQTPKKTSLRGIWKGIDISEQDFEDAKKSLTKLSDI